MGILQGKPYKVRRKQDDGTYKFVTVIPEPIDMGIKKYDTKSYNTEINRKRLLKERQAANRENGL